MTYEHEPDANKKAVGRKEIDDAKREIYSS
jgi:hypothetical protein